MIEWGLEWHALDTYFQFKEVSSIDTPPADHVRLAAKDSSGTSTLCYKNDAGTEVCLPTSGTIVTGTGVAGRVAFWNGTSTLSSDSDLTFSVDTLTATKIVAPTSITDGGLTAGRITFAGTAGLLSDSAKLTWDNTNNVASIGGGTSLTASGVRALEIFGTGSEALSSLVRMTANGTGATGNFQGRMSRGTAGTPTATQADDLLVQVTGIPFGATAYAAAKRASMTLRAGENQTDAAQGTYITFETTPLLSTTIAERFRIGPSGQWGIGGATFGTAGNYFRSGGASAAPTWQQVKFTELDFTGSNLTSIATRSHADLQNLSADDHTQYALLAGRSGGQTLIGGTASGNDLTLQSTSNATRGTVIIADLVNSTTERSFRIGTSNNSTLFAGAIPAVVEVAGSSAGSTAGYHGINISTQFTGSADNVGGLFIETLHQPSASVTRARGALVYPIGNPGSTVTITRFEGIEFGYQTGGGAGAITDAMAFVVGGPSLGTLKPTTGTGIRIDNQGASGITTAIGLDIAAMSGATNNWGVRWGHGNATGTNAPLLGSNFPGAGGHLTAPHTWLEVTAADGTVCAMPAWQI